MQGAKGEEHLAGSPLSPEDTLGPSGKSLDFSETQPGL